MRGYPHYHDIVTFQFRLTSTSTSSTWLIRLSAAHTLHLSAMRDARRCSASSDTAREALLGAGMYPVPSGQLSAIFVP